jgi:1,4-alpha-glucan branching enzyme
MESQSNLRSVFAAFLLVVSASYAVAAGDPLGATPHSDGTTFRVWAPFVDTVAVKVNAVAPVPMAKEAGHPDAADTTWSAVVPGAKAGDHYRYIITCKGAVNEFTDPRSLQLTSYNPSAWSVIVDPGQSAAGFGAPPINNTVIYELHVGSFHADTAGGRFDFAGAAEKLDYLKDLGINAVEVMPINENSRPLNHMPPSFDWGYDPLQYFAIKSAYGTPEQFKDFVARCHSLGIAVILDVVYNHVTAGTLLEKWGGFSAPGVEDGVYFYGVEARTPWGPRPDFSGAQVRDYIEDNVRLWLSQFGCDGLRWDSVSNIRNFEGGRGSHTGANPDGVELMRESNKEFSKKIMIAEDLQGYGLVTTPIEEDGMGFSSQWDNGFCAEMRRVVSAANDTSRDVARLGKTIEAKIGPDPFGRVIYSEDHDQVGHPKDRTAGKPQVRVPAIIDPGDPSSLFARRRSNLAAAIVLTSPGIPMVFQGQEMLDSRPFVFERAEPILWSRVTSFGGVVSFYRDLIALRRNIGGTTAGLTGRNTKVVHVDPENHTLAYRRWEAGGARDDVMVILNLSNAPLRDLKVGFPSAGQWIVRLNSDSSKYDDAAHFDETTDVAATPDPADGLDFSGRVSIGPYAAVIFSQN